MLIEATKGTWLLGVGIGSASRHLPFSSLSLTQPEHSTLYQTNYNSARNVFTGFQQSESPYWQGPGNPSYAPDPWGGASSFASDPDFSWCDESDGQCRMALYQRISGCRNMSLYGSGFWTFFNNGHLCKGNCHGTAVQIEDTEGLWYWGLNTRYVNELVRDKGDVVATSLGKEAGWGAAVAGFLRYA